MSRHLIIFGGLEILRCCEEGRGERRRNLFVLLEGKSPISAPRKAYPSFPISFSSLYLLRAIREENMLYVIWHHCNRSLSLVLSGIPIPIPVPFGVHSDRNAVIPDVNRCNRRILTKRLKDQPISPLCLL